MKTNLRQIIHVQLFLIDKLSIRLHYRVILPNGTINWGCPCLGTASIGPCSMLFRNAFKCFHFSEAKSSHLAFRLDFHSKDLGFQQPFFPTAQVSHTSVKKFYNLCLWSRPLPSKSLDTTKTFLTMTQIEKLNYR
ncbi:mitochondrial intermembrane space import and assembly 40 [Brachionus plicatilis]|uniref:Mitochondrial intermembrane space import and assembly 40 n=1 Tax=Brachionus plicatilis TaxID=10195 RepID=A0A3M7PJS5_BRAPC|nr:mitochondrial intermembrane space import and assembly 40 [Brachionus plicatilis]